MARRNFYDIVTHSEFNLSAEYARLYTLFYDGTDLHCSVSDLVENAFECFPPYLVGRTINLSDFDDTYNFCFPRSPFQLSTEVLITFCEYIWNFNVALLSHGARTIDEDDAESINHLQDKIYECMTDLGMMLHQAGNLFVFVEKSPEVVATIELVDAELAGDVLRYHHHSLKGDLTKKRTILKQMADNIESERKKLSAINKTLENQLFQLMNKFVRHDHSKTPYIATMQPREIEECYDDIYQMWLLAKLELDHYAERKDRVAHLLETINQ